MKIKKILLFVLLLFFPIVSWAVPVSWDGNFTTQLLVPLNTMISSHVGIGSSTPGGLLSIHAPSNFRLATSAPLLLIASSTPSSTSTFFNLSNVGSTTIFGILNVGSNSSTTAVLGTSTFNNGIRLTSGCFLLPSGSCAGTGGGAGGIITLNGLTADPQTFSVIMPPLIGGRYATLTISSSGSDHRFIIEASSSPTYDNLFATSTIAIGTTTPGSGLSVHGTSTQITGTTTTHALVATSTLLVGNINNPSLIVLQNGFLGLGTSSPGSKLSVQEGNTQVTGTSTSHALVATSTLLIGEIGAPTLLVVPGGINNDITILAASDGTDPITRFIKVSAQQGLNVGGSGLTLTGGNGVGTGVGGDFNMNGGSGVGAAAAGGNIAINGGSSVSGVGGSASLGGAGGGTNSAGGDASIASGSGNGSGAGGELTLTASGGGLTGAGGNVNIVSGSGNGGAAPGSIIFKTNSGGSERMRLISTGFLGLSSTTPWGKLSIEAGSTNGTTTPLFIIGSSGTTSPFFMIGGNGKVGIATTSGWGRLSIEKTNQEKGTTSPLFVIGDQGTTTPFFFVNGEGMIGIGTSTPWGAFSIEKTALAGVGSSSPLFVVSDQGTSTPFLLIDGKGSLGIGTSTPWSVFSLEPRSRSSSTTPMFIVANQGTTTNNGISAASATTSPFFFIHGVSGRIGIGTTSPLATTTINGHLQFGGKQPVISACGTAPGGVVGNDSVGKVTTGTGVFSSCTLTFDVPWTNPPACNVQDESTVLFTRAKSTQTTVVFDVGTAFTASDVLAYHCVGYE